MNPVSTDSSNQLALYNQSLKGLRYQAHNAPDKALKQSAQQFEALFINEMLKSMRESIPQSGLLNTDQIKTFTALHDQQLSQDIATHRGLGLADLIIHQLSKTTVAPASTQAPGPVSSGQADPASSPANAHSGSAPSTKTLTQGLQALKNLPDLSINKGGGFALKD